LAGASTAIAVLMAALASPAAALPLAKSGVGASSDIVTVEWKHPAGGGGGAAPHLGGHPGGGHPGGGHWGGGGGGGGWHHHGGGGGWGGPAIGAAIGFGILGAAAAAASYGSPPEPGMCWYYDNPMQTSGHWDYCQ
jgi:hypothetical protein